MAGIWIKIKLGVILVAIAYVLAFLLGNSGKAVELWLFPTYSLPNIPLLVLIFACIALGAVGAILVRVLRSTIRQLRANNEKKRVQRLERENEEMKLKASKLQQQPPKAE